QHGEAGVVPMHPGAVVGDADQLHPARLHVDSDAPRAGVDRVLHQLLDHAGRPLDHLPRGDLVGEIVGQDADQARGAPTGRAGGIVRGGGHGSSVVLVARATASKYTLVRPRVSASTPSARGSRSPSTSLSRRIQWKTVGLRKAARSSGGSAVVSKAWVAAFRALIAASMNAA